MGNCSNNKKNYGEQTEQCDLGVTRSAIHNGPILNIQSFREDGLLTCGDDKKIAIVDYPSLRSDLNYQPRYLEGHTKAVSRLAVLDEERFVSASRDLSLRQVLTPAPPDPCPDASNPFAVARIKRALHSAP